MTHKYELLPELRYFGGRKVYRIRALRDFGNVHKWDVGGWIERTSNLAHRGDAWIYDNACVFGYARVSGNAIVCENAWVYDYAKISGNAWVGGNAEIYGHANIGGNAWIGENTVVECHRTITE